MTRGRSLRIAAGLLAAGLLAGCAMSDDRAASLLVAPGDYDIYACPQLALAAAAAKKRRDELQGLMARAETESSGRLMSALGYRPEYLKIRGELHEMEATAREKHCDLSDVPNVASQPPTPSRPPPALVQPQR
ncbi:MAG: hypothetical protein ACTHLO_17040 [Pseudolabrys sp.]